jgi:hypothetical protein
VGLIRTCNLTQYLTASLPHGLTDKLTRFLHLFWCIFRGSTRHVTSVGTSGDGILIQQNGVNSMLPVAEIAGKVPSLLQPGDDVPHPSFTQVLSRVEQGVQGSATGFQFPRVTLSEDDHCDIHRKLIHGKATVFEMA